MTDGLSHNVVMSEFLFLTGEMEGAEGVVWHADISEPLCCTGGPVGLWQAHGHSVMRHCDGAGCTRWRYRWLTSWQRSSEGLTWKHSSACWLSTSLQRCPPTRSPIPATV